MAEAAKRSFAIWNLLYLKRRGKGRGRQGDSARHLSIMSIVITVSTIIILVADTIGSRPLIICRFVAVPVYIVTVVIAVKTAKIVVIICNRIVIILQNVGTIIKTIILLIERVIIRVISCPALLSTA
jgi:hypothetical protein